MLIFSMLGMLLFALIICVGGLLAIRLLAVGLELFFHCAVVEPLYHFEHKKHKLEAPEPSKLSHLDWDGSSAPIDD
jgi:hypothetical protein